MKTQLKKICSKNGLWWFLFYTHKVLKLDRFLTDQQEIDFLSLCNTGKKINWKNPRTFNEKLSWLKVFGRNKQYNIMADKYAVKSMVAPIMERGGGKIVPCYGVYEKFDDIDFDKLPQQFILKCTHDSSGIYPCKDKSQFDRAKAKEIIEKSLKRNYYWGSREWIYKDIAPRVLADKFLDDGRPGELQDYKWWCFNGEPRIMYITNKGKAGQVYENFYDMDFNPVGIDHGFPRTVPEYEKPRNFELMKNLCSALLADIKPPFVRVDFFDINGEVYFGEFTFYDHAGMRPFVSKDWDLKMGSWIMLPEKR